MFDKEFNFVASTTEHLIYCYIWLPDEGVETKGILQISHGMTEHARRYDDFARFMTDNGYIVCAHDHAVHGKSVDLNNTLGFFSDKDGYKHLVKDLHKVTVKIRDMYPGLPIYLLGHSMGSFIARLYVLDYGKELAGVMYSGTNGGSGKDGFFALLVKTLSIINGTKSSAVFVDKKSKASYNKHFAPIISGIEWQTSDKEEIKKFHEDPLCQFIFTYSGYNDVLAMMHRVNRKSWFKNAPDIPTFIFSGAKDPIGGMGLGVMRFYTRMKLNGLTNVKIRIYENGRHEMLNEVNREDVYKDIIKWIETGEVDYN